MIDRHHHLEEGSDRPHRSGVRGFRSGSLTGLTI